MALQRRPWISVVVGTERIDDRGKDDSWIGGIAIGGRIGGSGGGVSNVEEDRRYD